MHPHPWSDKERATAQVVVMVWEIRDSGDDERERLLAEFLEAAWPSRRAQRR